MKTPTVIFLHGGPGLPDYLADVFGGRFGDRLESVFYTQRQECVDSIDGLLDELDARVAVAAGAPILLAGHSWGGMLATEYASRCSGRIDGLILMSSAYSAEYKQLRSRLRETQSPSPQPLEGYLVTDEMDEWAPFVERLFAQANRVLYAAIESSFMSRFDHGPFLSTTTIPILNLYGEHDGAIPSTHQRALGRLNSRIRSVEVTGAAHFPFLQNHHRAMVVRALIEFASAASHGQPFHG